MFNRLLRCISLAKTSLNLSPPRSISPRLLTRGDLLLKEHFCSSIIGKQSESTEKQNAAGTSPDEMAEQELKNLIESDPAIEKRYKILQLEVDVMKHGGRPVPDKLKAHHWIQLLNTETRSQRRKFLQFLFTSERRQENQKEKKEQARIKREELRALEPPDEDKSDYGVHKVSMVLRIYDTTMNHFYNTRLIQSMMFGPKVIIDCGFHDQMTPRESAECAKQLAYTFAQNRLHPQPFDIHFCNVNKSSLMMQKLHRIMPPIYDPDFPLNISEESYTEIFDKKQLVYLTPDCNNELQNFDPDSLYIIGGIVDRTNAEPLSMAKAKKEGLRMAKLPLSKYLLWGSGSGKRLALNQMVNILTDLRVTGDWKIALQHVPRRKLERSIYDLNSDFEPREKGERQNDRPFKPFKQNDRPFRPVKQNDRNSFKFKDRQKRTFNE